MKYTRDDIIFYPDDPRLKGKVMKVVAFGDEPLAVMEDIENGDLSEDVELTEVCEDSLHPFVLSDDGGEFGEFVCIVLDKTSKDYEPFDFSKKKTRDALEGVSICHEVPRDDGVIGDYTQIKGFSKVNGKWICDGFGDAEYVLNHCTYADTGKPVGRKIGR